MRMQSTGLDSFQDDVTSKARMSPATLKHLEDLIESGSNQLQNLQRESREVKKVGLVSGQMKSNDCEKSLENVLKLSEHLVDDVGDHMSKVRSLAQELEAKVEKLTRDNELLNQRLLREGQSDEGLFFIFVWIKNLVLGTIPPNSAGYHPQSVTELAEYLASIFGIGHLGSVFHAFAGHWLCQYWNVEPPSKAKVR